MQTVLGRMVTVNRNEKNDLHYAKCKFQIANWKFQIWNWQCLILPLCLILGALHPAWAAEAKDSKPKPAESKEAKSKPVEVKADPYAWKDLFDGKTLKGWKTPHYGGEGKVEVRDGAIVLERGGMMTGVTWAGEVLRNNYELTLEGKRLEGSDFFCTTTFPVGKGHCSLVVGGWGGGVVGLSCVDGADAAENDTTAVMEFKDDRWYRIRIRVTDDAIEAWIDDKPMVNQPRRDHQFDVRLECDLACPLGVCTWDTKGAVRNIRVRAVKPVETK